MRSPKPHLAGAALLVALLSGCAATPPTGTVISLYQEAMAAAARPPTRSEDKAARQADRATRAVEAWREGASGGEGSQPAAGQL